MTWQRMGAARTPTLLQIPRGGLLHRQESTDLSDRLIVEMLLGRSSRIQSSEIELEPASLRDVNILQSAQRPHIPRGTNLAAYVRSWASDWSCLSKLVPAPASGPRRRSGFLGVRARTIRFAFLRGMKDLCSDGRQSSAAATETSSVGAFRKWSERKHKDSSCRNRIFRLLLSSF